jgi:hypothetical protein
LDATLDPQQLWATADKLAREEANAEEAVFLYLVALFMDNSLDAQDKQHARWALAAYNEKSPMAVALGIAINIDLSNRRKTCSEAHDDIMTILTSSSFSGVDERRTASFEKINRFQFGLAMYYIFSGRIAGRCLAVNSIEEANSRTYKEAYESIVTPFSTAKTFLDPSRWLTFQYELGYSNSDVVATDEAKRWFKLFFSGLDNTERKNGTLNRHWATMKSHAETRYSMISILEMAAQNGI